MLTKMSNPQTNGQTPSLGSVRQLWYASEINLAKNTRSEKSTRIVQSKVGKHSGFPRPTKERSPRPPLRFTTQISLNRFPCPGVLCYGKRKEKTFPTSWMRNILFKVSQTPGK